MLLMLAFSCADDCSLSVMPGWDGTTEQCAAVVACAEPFADVLVGGQIETAWWVDGTMLCTSTDECDALRDGLVWFACDKFVPDAEAP